MRALCGANWVAKLSKTEPTKSSKFPVWPVERINALNTHGFSHVPSLRGLIPVIYTSSSLSRLGMSRVHSPNKFEPVLWHRYSPNGSFPPAHPKPSDKAETFERNLRAENGLIQERLYQRAYLRRTSQKGAPTLLAGYFANRIGLCPCTHTGQPAPLQGSGCRVQGSRCRVQGAGLRVKGFKCRVRDAGFRVQGAGCRVHQGAGCRVLGAGFRVQGAGSMVMVGVSGAAPPPSWSSSPLSPSS